MNRKYIALTVAAVLVATGGGFAWFKSYPDSFSVIMPDNEAAEKTTEVPNPYPPYVPEDGIVNPILPVEQLADHVVEITTAGFSPANVIMKKGDSVVWTNRDIASHWVLSDVSAKYPEKGTCGTKLDACAALKLGDSFRATLSQTGTWKYYDKLNAKFKGTIVVQ